MQLREWIENRKEAMIDLLQSWSAINSWTQNCAGLSMMSDALKEAFASLPCTLEEIELAPWQQWKATGERVEVPLGKALVFRRNTKSSRHLLLGGHMDTVFPPSSPFQNSTREGSQLLGPGVADMKGGLAVLLLALRAFEHFKGPHELGWEVIISPDEEIGSPGSHFLWEKAASKARFGLLFEPSFADGALVDSRKGSANYTLIVKGKAAHAGRDIHLGRSAVKALATFIVQAYAAAEKFPDMSLNVAPMRGGEAVNIVAEDSYCRINMRSFNLTHLQELQKILKEKTERIAEDAEVNMQLLLELNRSPKLFEGKTVSLYNRIGECAKEAGMPFSLRPSGGLSDGNLLAACNLPTIDSLGVVGGNLHTDEEYMLIDSLSERAHLASLLLLKYAQGLFPELEK